MKIKDVMSNIIGPGGLASSNRYQISFQFGGNQDLADAVGVKDSVPDPVTYETGPIDGKAAILSYLADEVNIPGFSVSTGDFEGHAPGMNQKYAHTKTFRDFTITFLMDQDHLPYKMLHKWAEFIFPFQNTNSISIEDANSGPNLRNFVLTEYYNNYTCNMVIDKTEHIPGKKQLKDKLPVKSSLFLYNVYPCLLYTSPSPRDRTRSRMPSSA